MGLHGHPGYDDFPWFCFVIPLLECVVRMYHASQYSCIDLVLQVPYLSGSFGVIYILVKPSVCI